jgi:hypothetical protein
MTSSLTTTDWPEVVDVLVADGDGGLFVFYVQTPDERAVHSGDLNARTQRSALIEITAWMADQGYQPTERWDTENDDAMRRFRTTSDA